MKKVTLTALLILTTFLSFSQISEKVLEQTFKFNNTQELLKELSNSNKNNCVKVNNNEYTLLALSIKHNNSKVFKILLSKKADLEKTCSGKTPLMYAAKYGRLNFLKRLIKKGADPHKKNSRGRTALDYANKYEKAEIVNYLKSL